MGSLLRLLMLLRLATCASAAELRPGDQVRFVERDQHIPAYPAPGDTRVHLRFVSGSEATVLQVNPATGWIEVRGEPLQGRENTGWITPRYLAGRPDGEEPPPSSLAWCPANATRLRLRRPMRRDVPASSRASTSSSRTRTGATMAKQSERISSKTG